MSNFTTKDKLTMNNIFKKIITLSLFLVLPFCGAYAQTTYSGAEVTQKVIYQNQSKNTVTVTSIQSNTQNGLLNIRADVLNNSAQKVHLYYRALWRNAQGQQLNADAWKPILLLPNKSSSINATAPLTNATDFALEIKTD